MKHPIMKRLPRILFQGPIHMLSAIVIHNCICQGYAWLNRGLPTPVWHSPPHYAASIVFALVAGGFLADYILSAFDRIMEFAITFWETEYE